MRRSCLGQGDRVDYFIALWACTLYCCTLYCCTLYCCALHCCTITVSLSSLPTSLPPPSLAIRFGSLLCCVLHTSGSSRESSTLLVLIHNYSFRFQELRARVAWHRCLLCRRPTDPFIVRRNLSGSGIEGFVRCIALITRTTAWFPTTQLPCDFNRRFEES